MTITTYYATHKLGRSDNEANAIVHLINDVAYSSGDHRSWDATRAHIEALTDTETQQRFGITIEAEHAELESED